MSADEFDPLADLLGRRDAGSSNDELRQKALADTLPVLRRRRVVRRAGWTLAFAGCYLAGLATSGFWHGGEANPLVADDRPIAPVQPEKPQPTGGARLAEQPERQKTPFERLRDAGDEACQRQGDIEAAIRLYAQALEVATPEEKKITAADDSWLLIALKQDHIEENENANHEIPIDDEAAEGDRS